MFSDVFPVVGSLAKCYVEAIQNGAVPCIQNAVETTAQIENAAAVRDSLELYRYVFDTNSGLFYEVHVLHCP